MRHVPFDELQGFEAQISTPSVMKLPLLQRCPESVASKPEVLVPFHGKSLVSLAFNRSAKPSPRQPKM
jgi:hypothetical protein